MKHAAATRWSRETLHRTGFVIERVPVGEFVDAVPAVREEGDVTILPVVEEVVVTTRRLRLVEEVRIRRVHSTDAHVETVTLREQHVVVTRSDPVIQEAGIPASVPAPPDPSLQRRDYSHERDDRCRLRHPRARRTGRQRPAGRQRAAIRHPPPCSRGQLLPANTSVSTRRTEETGGFWSSLFGGSSDDHSVYDRTLESGGNVVSVSTIPEHDYESVMTILEKHNPVDIDERAATYSTSSSMTTGAATGAAMGMTGADMTTANTMSAGTMSAGTMGTGAMSTSTMSTGMTASTGMTGAAYAGTVEQGGTLQLAEEQLAVGKRLVNRGGTRVRRYVVETPVEESVSLHEEKVTLERHPVTDGRPVTDSFSDRTIELTESAEEAVVSKTARVVEEVQLGKVATDRTETVRDTIRKEEVEIEQLPGTATTTGTVHTSTTVSGTTPKI